MLSWDGTNTTELDMTGIPRTDTIRKGDTIFLTGNYSLKLPTPGKWVGTVTRVLKDESSNFYLLKSNLPQILGAQQVLWLRIWILLSKRNWTKKLLKSRKERQIKMSFVKNILHFFYFCFIRYIFWMYATFAWTDYSLFVFPFHTLAAFFILSGAGYWFWVLFWG